MPIQKICAGFETTLAAKLTAGGTSFTLSSHLTKKGVELSGEYGFILGEGTATEEWLYGTISAGVVTIIKRGLDPEEPETEVTALKFDHDRGTTSVKITDYPFLGLVRKYLGGEKALPAPLKYATHQTPSEDTELIDKKYAQELLYGAVGTASPSAAGIIFTDQDMGAKPIAKTIIAFEQATPDMTIKVAPFGLAEIDKHVNFAGGNSPTFTAPVANPRIDILVYDIVAAALEVRAGSEDASPVAPALESGDIAIAKIYHKVGETSIKNSSDGTNGYIMALYNPAVTRSDILLNSDITVKRFETLPAYENLSPGDFLKAYNDNGTVKLKKVVGMGNTHTNFIELTTYASEQDIKAVFLTDSLVVFVYSKYNGYLCARAASISGKVMTLGSEINLTGTSTPAGWARYFEVSKVNDSSFVVTTLFKYSSNSNLLAIACSVSGTTITQGTGLSLYSYSAYGAVKSLSMCEIESGKFLIAFVAAYTSTPYFTRRAVVITVSGTTVSAGSTLTLQDNTDNSGLLSVAKFNTNKAYLVYGYGSSSTRYVYGRVLTISGTTITAGSENTHHSTTNGDVSGIRLIRHSDNNLLFSWAINTTYEPNFGKLVFSGDTPTYTKISTDVITGGQIVYRDGRLYARGFTYLVDIENNVLSLFATISTTLYPQVNGFSMCDISPNGLPIRLGNQSYSGGLYYFDPVLGDYDHADFITCANSAYNAGNSVPLVDIFNTFSNLILGATYYLNLAATGLTMSNTYQKIGKAISTTKIIK